MFRSGGLDVSATCITYHIGSAYRCTLAIATGVCVRAVVVAIAANLVATVSGSESSLLVVMFRSAGWDVSAICITCHIRTWTNHHAHQLSESSHFDITHWKASSDFSGECLAFVYIGNIFYMQHRSTIKVHSMLLGLFMEVELTKFTQIIT